MADDGKDEEKKMEIENENEEEEEGEQDTILKVAELQFSYKLAREVGNKEEAEKIWTELLQLYEENSLELYLFNFRNFQQLQQ